MPRMFALLVTLALAAPLAPLPVASAHTCWWRAGLGTFPPGEDCPIPCPNDGRYHRHSWAFIPGARLSDDGQGNDAGFPGWVGENLNDFGWLFGEGCTGGPGSGSFNPCDDQLVHTYGLGGAVFVAEQSVGAHGSAVSVQDTNLEDCNGMGPGAFDGDYDSGVGGGFFGYGQWAADPDCDFRLNAHGPNVVLNDVVFGNAVSFVVGENDRSGPVKVWDPVTGTADCETDGRLAPCPDNDPAQCGPADDPDDCISQVYVGMGETCGAGGGDGGYWVILGVGAQTSGGIGLANPPTAGTIMAF